MSHTDLEGLTAKVETFVAELIDKSSLDLKVAVSEPEADTIDVT